MGNKNTPKTEAAPAAAATVEDDGKVIRISSELRNKLMDGLGVPNSICWDYGIEGCIRHLLNLPQLPKTPRKRKGEVAAA